jgi:hypothetical protein
MDNNYLYIVGVLALIAVFFIFFIYFKSRDTSKNEGLKNIQIVKNIQIQKDINSDPQVECNGDKCFIKHKQTNKCDGEKCI